MPGRSDRYLIAPTASIFEQVCEARAIFPRRELISISLRLPAAEAIHLANLLCQYGYFFPVGESRSLIVKDDSSLYRFQVSVDFWFPYFLLRFIFIIIIVIMLSSLYCFFFFYYYAVFTEVLKRLH